MARDRRTVIGVDVVADDNASATIDTVAGRADELDGRTATVDVTADTDTARTELEQTGTDVAELDGATARLTVQARADAARDELRQARAALAELDGMVARARVEAIGAAAARGDVDEVLRLVNQLDGKTARVNVTADTGAAAGSAGSGAGLAGLAARFGFSSGAAAGAGAALAATWAINVTMDGADAAIQAQTLADLFGSSVEDASRLASVMATAGVDASDLADIVLQMEGALRDNADMADQLGINVTDGKDSAARFVEVVEALATKYDDAGERSQAAARLFGEEGVRQVGTVTTVVGDLSDALAAIADERVISDDDVQAARDLLAESRALSSEWEGFKRRVGELVDGPMTSLLGVANQVLGGPSRLDRWVEFSRYVDSIAGTVELTAQELQTIAATEYGITLDTAAATTMVNNLNAQLNNATRPRTVPVTFTAPTAFGRLPWESSYPSGPLQRSAAPATVVVNLPRGWRDYTAGSTATRIASRSGVIAARGR